MPVIRSEEMTFETGRTPACGPHRLAHLGQAGELTQFGAVIEELPPGSASSIRHWHSDEDEFVLMLEGEATLLEGDEETTLRAGDAATFRAGEPAGHCLVNRGGANARYLVVGTRSPQDRVTYPDRGIVLSRDDAAGTRIWTDAQGGPAQNPYLGGRQPV